MAKRTVICVTLMVLMSSNSAYRHQSTSTSHQGRDPYDYYDPHQDIPSPNPISSNQHQRYSHTYVAPRTNKGYRGNLEEERPEHYHNDQHSDLCDDGEERITERSQVAVERAVPIRSDVQKVQDSEKTRRSFDSRKKSGQDRSINGTGKIVNSPKISTRRGDLTQEITDRVHSILNKSISVVMKIMRNGQPSRVPGNNRTSMISAHNGVSAQSSDSVVFPGEASSSTARDFAPSLSDLPEDCKKLGFCENVTNYPYDHVAQLVAKLGESRKMFTIDQELPDLAQRIGNDEQEMCKLTQKVVMPQVAHDKEGNWHYILNTRDTPLQGFLVEICEQDHSACNSAATFISGYEASCKQKYVLRYMTSIDKITGQPVQRSFKMPSCCSCVLSHFE